MRRLHQPDDSEMRRPSKFRKNDVTRATKAVRDAGFEIDRVEIAHDGSIIVVPRKSAELHPDDEGPEDLRKLR
jgi:hypothetical protein